MRILFSCVPFDNGKSGISVYMRHVVSALADEGHDLTLVIEKGMQNFFPEAKQFIVAPDIVTRKAVLSMLWHLFILPFKIRRGQFDLIVIGAANRRMLSFSRVPVIPVIHDLSQYHIDGKYDLFRTFYIKKVLPFFVRRSKKVIAISNSTKNDLVKYWHIPEDRITVAWNGLSIQNFPPDPARDYCREHSLEKGKYILYISRIEVPGKNHINLIKAYILLNEELKREYKLVLAGSDWSGAEKVHEYAKSLPESDSIIFTGFLPDCDLADAYKNAACYVFPSLYEGFGLSLVEAMYYGTPCACSNNSSLGEIGEGAALLFDPENPKDISEKISKILTDKDLHKRLSDAGLEHCKKFDWRKHAYRITSLFSE